MSIEGPYKTQLTKTIYRMFGTDHCAVVRLDSALLQGIPDMGILFDGGFWALLEAKTSRRARIQPNQPYYVDFMNQLCFAAFIYPDNEEAVLNALQEEYESHRRTRLP